MLASGSGQLSHTSTCRHLHLVFFLPKPTSYKVRTCCQLWKAPRHCSSFSSPYQCHATLMELPLQQHFSSSKAACRFLCFNHHWKEAGQLVLRHRLILKPTESAFSRQGKISQLKPEVRTAAWSPSSLILKRQKMKKRTYCSWWCQTR